jgi:nitrite reductase/ring-hydroxylating ferredoxin subunit
MVRAALVWGADRGGRVRVTSVVIEGGVLVVRLDDGRVARWRNACPHMGIELDWDAARVLSRSGRYLVCTGHGALFDPATGVCVRGPCVGEHLMEDV